MLQSRHMGMSCYVMRHDYLLRHEKTTKMSSLTRNSNADMPTVPPGEKSLVFAKPHYEDQRFEDLLEYVARQETDPDFPADAEVRYAQTRKLDHVRYEKTVY